MIYENRVTIHKHEKETKLQDPAAIACTAQWTSSPRGSAGRSRLTGLGFQSRCLPNRRRRFTEAPAYVYGHTHSKSMDQPGKVASPARGQLSRKMNISLSAFVPENLVSRDGFGSPVPRQPAHLHTQAEYGAYLRNSSRVPRRRPFIHLR